MYVWSIDTYHTCFLCMYLRMMSSPTLLVNAYKTMQICLHRFIYLSSCLNPILYAFLSDNFRKAFHNLMPCCMKMRGGPTHPGHHALRYELTTMKSSTRGRRSLRDIRRRKPKKCMENGVSTTNDLRTDGAPM